MKLARLFFVMFISWVCYGQAYGQSTEMDSLFNYLESNSEPSEQRAEVLSRLSYLHNGSDPQKGVELGQQAVELAELLDDDHVRARAYNSVGVNYFMMGDYANALDNYNLAIGFKESIQDARGAAMTKVNLGLIYWRQSAYPKALKTYNEALSYFEEADEKNLMSAIYLNQSLLYNEMSDWDMAISTGRKGLLIAEELGIKGTIFKILNLLGSAHLDKGEPEIAFQFMRKSLAFTRANNDVLNEIRALHNLGGAHFSQNRYDSAGVYYSESLRLAREKDNDLLISYGLTRMGRLQVAQEQYALANKSFDEALVLRRKMGGKRSLASALRYSASLDIRLDKRGEAREKYLESLEIGEEIGHQPTISSSARWLASEYERLGDFKKAYDYFKRYETSKSELSDDEKIKEYARLEAEFTADRERQELLAANAEEAFALKAEIDQQKLFQRIALVALIALLIIAVIYYRFYRIKVSVNQRLEEKNQQILKQKEALSFQADKLEMINSQLKMLGEFRAGLTQMIAHDMKNPLNTIIGLSDGEPSKSKAKDVTYAGYQLLNLVTNMLDVEKFEQADITPNYEYAQLDELMLEAKSQVDVLLNAKSIRLQNLIPKRICINADKDLSVRVMVNLLTNAIKYSKKDGMVKVTHSRSDDPNFIDITIRDYGNGISPERLPKIFDKFWSSEEKKSGVGVSTGLGLTFCKMAVESHGGRIKAESEVGIGTAITFSVPLDLQHTCESVWQKQQEEEVDQQLILKAERFMIEGYIESLRDLKVYQVSDISKLLKKMESDEIKSPWKSDLETAIYQGDQKRYNELVEMLN